MEKKYEGKKQVGLQNCLLESNLEPVNSTIGTGSRNLLFVHNCEQNHKINSSNQSLVTLLDVRLLPKT